ncbi:hypothetical protein DL237_15685 [Pseudooceanicola sediminis]|uniref:Uncharacterized protein n=1 Tax=Pseudooceanicola sediminis TaxID=2211117 RepID=A0A399IXG2_9RHOB|nr:hypothetical protein E0K93_15315 [Puniceibacterium sp. HSS470]RII37835.1 hypothetical protein DL237_15685 [Pseudooceanicola sediminis]
MGSRITAPLSQPPIRITGIPVSRLSTVPSKQAQSKRKFVMNSIIYLIGLIVIVLAIMNFVT